MPIERSLQSAADRDPDGVAVRWRDTSWSYERLASAATGVATTLMEAGIGPGDRVGIHMAKRPEAVAAVYGILRAGAAFVPLDPGAPGDYVRSIAADCRIAALIVNQDLALAWRRLEAYPFRLVVVIGGQAIPEGTGSRVVSFDQAASASATNPARVDETHPACVYYTSGSTGRPKGVVHRHGALTDVAEWTVAHVGVRADDRLAVHPPLHFVLSAYALFPAALAGATAVLVSEEQSVLGWELLRLIEGERITIWVSVPSALSLVRSAGPGTQAMASMRHMLISGEPLPPGLGGDLRGSAPHARVWNLYGTTEAWGITYRRLEDNPLDEHLRSLGRPWEDAEIVVVRQDGSRAQPGEEGELLVSSPKLMAGYWDDPEGTARVLVEDPSKSRPRRVFYRTGDIVRETPGGDYELVGRRDHQVTRRGYRLDLSEIEAALQAHPQVEAAAAATVPDPKLGVWITAFACPSAKARPDAADLAAFLAARLPGHLLPDRIEVVDLLPRTPSGKVDRRALADRAGIGR